jgi:hypothetical protein
MHAGTSRHTVVYGHKNAMPRSAKMNFYVAYFGRWSWCFETFRLQTLLLEQQWAMLCQA